MDKHPAAAVPSRTSQPYTFRLFPSFYPFYMFLAARTFSARRRVHNHFTKRILNLILNRKKFLRQGNETLDKQNRGKTAAANPARYTFSTNFVLVRRSSLERRRKLCAEALHHPFSNISSQPCIFHCPLKQRTSNRSPDSIMRH